MPPARAPHRCLGNAQAQLFSHCSQILLYSPPADSCETRGGGGVQGHGTCGGTTALLSGEVGSEAVGHVVAPEPCRAGMTGSDTTGHAVAHGHTPCFLAYLGACMLGYPVYKVSTVAPRPTSREVANLQVVPTSPFPAQPF
jgi:hypothetical protein